MFDSGPLISLYDPRDDRGIEIQTILQRSVNSGFPIIITIPIISETHRRLLYDVGYIAAYRFLFDFRRDITSDDINLLDTTDSDFTDALAIINRYSDQSITFTDAIVMSIMKRIGIQKVLSFDHHFWILNFTVIS